MSADAVAYTYRHSPCKGADLHVHLAIADSANDQNYNEFWMSIGRLANKARVERRTAGRAVAALCDLGLLTLLEDHSTERKPSRYRFEFPDLPVVYETRHGSREPMSRVEGTHAHGSREPTNPKRTEENPILSSKPSASPPRKRGPRDEIWDALVEAVGDARTSSEKSRRGKVITQLVDVGATPDEVRRRARALKQRWPGITLTDTGLVGRWSTADPPTNGKGPIGSADPGDSNLIDYDPYPTVTYT